MSIVLLLEKIVLTLGFRGSACADAEGHCWDFQNTVLFLQNCSILARALKKNTHRIGIIEWHNVHQLGRGVVSWSRGNHILGPRISIKFLLLAKCLDQGCGPVRAVRLSERHLAVLIGTCIAATTARPIAEVSHPRCRTMTQSISLGHPAAGKILIKSENSQKAHYRYSNQDALGNNGIQRVLVIWHENCRIVPSKRQLDLTTKLELVACCWALYMAIIILLSFMSAPKLCQIFVPCQHPWPAPTAFHVSGDRRIGYNFSGSNSSSP